MIPFDKSVLKDLPLKKANLVTFQFLDRISCKKDPNGDNIKPQGMSTCVLSVNGPSSVCHNLPKELVV